MPYIAPEVVQQAKQMDLLTYLKNYEPQELVHVSGSTYSTRTHDSLKISNGKWMWWSQSLGGRSALDYLIKVKGYSFVEAVQTIAGCVNIRPPMKAAMEEKKKKLCLPEPYRYQSHVVSYLKNRGIDLEIIEFCLRTGRIYESAGHYNAVFVGRDEKEIPRYAAIRGVGTDFIGEAAGSDKNYSFCIPAEKKNRKVHLFESAIDLLSFATLLKMEGRDWRKEHLLSLAGVYQPAKKPEESKVPAALAGFLNRHPEVEQVMLHLDNDRTGRQATGSIQAVLQKRYQVQNRPPPAGKDYNDYLCMQKKLEITRRRTRQKERSKER